MPLNKAIIPLYLNSDILNNLFSIVVQEFIEIKSISTRDQVSVHLKAPVSEFSYDLFGKYVQGDFEFQIINEFAKQRTEEKISAAMVVLKQLKDILIAQNLLKYIDSADRINSIEENDFIDFSCRLNRNPVLQRVQDTIGAMDVHSAFNYGDDETLTEEDKLKHSQILTFMKNEFNSCKCDRCLRYVAPGVCNSKTAVIIPLKTCCMLDNEDYLLTGRVRVMGKVVKNFKNQVPASDESAAEGQPGSFNNSGRPDLSSHTIFDHIDFSQIQTLNNNQLLGNLLTRNINSIDQNFDGDIIEVLPLVIYI